MLLDISIIPQTSEELFYFITKRIPYLCGFWRFANAYINLSKKGWSLIWTQQQKLNYWRKGFRSWLPVKRKITGCAERLEGVSGNCKKNWKFVLKADISGRQGCCRYLNIHGCIKGVCNISEQKSSDIVWHPKLSCVVGVL